MISSIRIDVSPVSSSDELHELLAQRLGFPDYYGRNWDAFRDCVTDETACELPEVLEIVGFAALVRKLPRDAQRFETCLVDLQRERPMLVVALARQ